MAEKTERKVNMANNEFRDIKDFVDGFTRMNYPEKTMRYDGMIWGMEFEYHNRVFRVTRDTNGDEPDLLKMFGKDKNTDIKIFEIPKEIYPESPALPERAYLGVYSDVDDLLDNCKIDDIPLRNIIASEETIILAID